jgi:nucleoside 2-deoxyribosyltransferase
MAMDFKNPVLDRVVAEHFVPAVRETGFELYRLDDRPKPGIIDNRIRVEIRTAKFIVCDLTDENRGAYWEAGFAEGVQKPVFYTCERAKFESTKTHFDTEHIFTIKWDANNPSPAAEELKDAIRNEFPADATAPDLMDHG